MSAGGNGFSEATFAWFAGVEAHNDSAWFTEHREAFSEHVEEPFAQLLQDVTAQLSTTIVNTDRSTKSFYTNP